MKQYCRYCGFCIDIDQYYCTDQQKFLSEVSVKSTNNCKNYGYCGMDVVTGKDHKTRDYNQRHLKIDDGQQEKLF